MKKPKKQINQTRQKKRTKQARVKFPKNIKLLGTTWKIDVVEHLSNASGRINDDERIILIKKSNFKNKRHVERFEDTIFHELTHALLKVSCAHSLYTNEQIVVPLSKAIRDLTLQMVKINSNK